MYSIAQRSMSAVVRQMGIEHQIISQKKPRRVRKKKEGGGERESEREIC